MAHTHTHTQFAMLAEEYGLWAGIFTALITSLMFVTMGNIQAHVEDPFVLTPNSYY